MRNVFSRFLALFFVQFFIAVPALPYNFNLGSSYNAVPSSKGLPKENQGVTIQEHLGKKIDLNAHFRDENGKDVTLKQYVQGGKPLLLTFNYFRCKTLCGIQLTNLAHTLHQMHWPIGKDFRVITMSFDPTDDEKLAKIKHDMYLSQTEQPKGEWHFLTTNQKTIHKITDQVGFIYKYLPEKKQFSHAAAAYFIAPDGTITRYLYGITFKERDVKFSLIDASHGKIGSTTDRFLLFCCNYDPNAGAYTGLAMGLMRVVAVVSCLALGSVWFFYRKKNKKT